MTDRLPQAFALLRDGQVSEAQCQLLAVKASHLDDTDAAIVDAALAPRLTGWTVKKTEQAVQRRVRHRPCPGWKTTEGQTAGEIITTFPTGHQ